MRFLGSILGLCAIKRQDEMVFFDRICAEKTCFRSRSSFVEEITRWFTAKISLQLLQVSCCFLRRI